MASPALLSLGPPIRASEEERERAIEELKVHYAEGRIGPKDLEVRIGSAYGARTRQELRMLFSDLPRRSGRRLMARFYSLQRRLLGYHAAGFAAINGLLIGVWALTGEGRFWPAAVLVPSTVLIVSHGSFTHWLRDHVHRR